MWYYVPVGEECRHCWLGGSCHVLFGVIEMSDMNFVKTWWRLGCNLMLTTSEIERIKNGQSNIEVKEILSRTGGIQFVGDSYAPEQQDLEERFCYEMNADFNEFVKFDIPKTVTSEQLYPVWARVGGYLLLTEGECVSLREGGAALNLVDVLKRSGGLMLCGDSYIPEDCIWDDKSPELAFESEAQLDFEPLTIQL